MSRMKRLAGTSLVVVGLLGLPVALSAQKTSRRPIDHVSAVPSPDGSWIAFIADGSTADNLHVVKPDGTAGRRLTHDGATLPRWVGNPAEITFAGTGKDSGRVFAIRPDGGGRRLVAEVEGRSPVLSPDGRRVAFVRGPWRQAEIWVSAIDSSGARRVAGGWAPLRDRWTSAWNPAWSPDGSRLAYTHGDSTRLLQVHIVKVVGSVRDTTVTDSTDFRLAGQMPAWSPDGRRLAIQTTSDHMPGIRIGVIDLPTRSFRILDVPVPADVPVESVRDEVPAWFPDGRRIAFQSNRGGDVDIWVMNDDGTEARQVTGQVHTPDGLRKPTTR
jgi:TolB protein